MGLFESPSSSINKKTKWSQEQAFPETADSFEKRIEKAMSNLDNSLKSETMMAIADDITKNHPELVLNSSEQEFALHCDGYDPAVINALCRTIQKGEELLSSMNRKA